MNDRAANAMPRTSQSHGNGLNGACSGAPETRLATAKSESEDEGEADPASWRLVASFAVDRSAGAGVGDGRRWNGAPGDPDADAGAASFCGSSAVWLAGAEVAAPLA